MSQSMDCDLLGDNLFELRMAHQEAIKWFNRRGRSPLKFVEAYEHLRTKFTKFLQEHGDGDSAVSSVRNWLEHCEDNYSRCLPLADEQFKRNEMWKRIYSPGISFLQGGRADGNGS